MNTMETLVRRLLPFVLVLCLCGSTLACRDEDWYEMSMEQLLMKSDIVVYGKDVGHGKFRLPIYMDARFDIYCVFKNGEYRVPGQVIIENLDGAAECSGVRGQTEEGKEYILGLNRELSGFMSYAVVNPTQATAFPATQDNFQKLASLCGLDQWSVPSTGEQDRCPVPQKPRFCVKVRYPEDLMSAGRHVTGHVIQIFLAVAVVIVAQRHI